MITAHSECQIEALTISAARQIYAFFQAGRRQAQTMANEVDAHHMRYHMLLGRTSTMSRLGDRLL